MYKLLATVLLMAFSLNANALSILLSGGHYGDQARDVTDRLTSLGHTVTKSNASHWVSNWDYSPYDVVAIQYASNEVGVPYGTSEYNETNNGGINNLLSAVQNDEVGVVFFRGWAADLTAGALGIAETGENFPWQYATENGQSNFDIIDTSHSITQGMSLGINDLGYTYMGKVTNPGANTTVLANGDDGAALVVHNELRIVSTPFYGYSCTMGNCLLDYEVDNAPESALGIQLTENSLQWAAGNLTVVPVPAAVWLFGSALAGLGWFRRKSAV